VSVQAAERYQDRLESLADAAGKRLARLWAWILEQPDPETEWERIARPLLTGAAQQAVGVSQAFALTAHRPLATGTASKLIVPEAATHVADPWLIVSARLGDGADFTEAHRIAGESIDSLASDTVMGSGRDALADQMPTLTEWKRRLNGGACKWCLSLSDVTWYAAHEATFGHSRCRCVAVPVDDLGDHNEKMRQAAGWDKQAQQQYRKRDQIKRLRESEANAMERSRRARLDQKNEPDPARSERLSQREQDWETRAERAAEKRRILETGSHRLAA